MVLQDEAFGKWVGHEGGALMNRISALIKETPESYLDLDREKTATSVWPQARGTEGIGAQPRRAAEAPVESHWGWEGHPVKPWGWRGHPVGLEAEHQAKEN